MIHVVLAMCLTASFSFSFSHRTFECACVCNLLVTLHMDLQYAVALAVSNTLDEAVSELGWTDDATGSLNDMVVPSPRVSAAVTLW